MPIVFERPVGPHCDIKELEYVSALLQTGPAIRRDGTVTSEDVVTYLKSRHGVEADVEYIRTVFMPGLAGALGENTDPIFDIVEIVCILLIPHFVREKRKPTTDQDDEDEKKDGFCSKIGRLFHRPRKNEENDEEEEMNVDEEIDLDYEKEEEKDFFSNVLDMILRDLTGSAVGERPKLTREFMQAILACYGEEENARPEDVDAMLLAAGVSGDDVDHEFTPELLAKACTSDLKQYRLEWEDSETTHFDDCFRGTYLDVKASDTGEGLILGSLKRKDDTQGTDDPKLVAESSHLDKVREVKRVFTFPSIDYVAENYRSVTFSVILWITLVVLYASYVADAEGFSGRTECDHFRSEFACSIVNAIVNWLIIFTQLSIMGVAFVVLGSAGNSIYAKADCASFLHLLVGLGTLCLCCIYTYASNERFFFANLEIDDNPADRFIGGFAMACGLVLILFQLRSLLMLLIPSSWYDRKSFVQLFLVSGMARKEKKTKQAARFKTYKIVKNAMSMHEVSLSSKSPRSMHGNTTAYGSALLAFEGTMDDREDVGGILWTYKSIFDGTLFDQEGVWLHTKLIASNLSQYTVGFFYLLYFPMLMYYFIWYEEDEEEPPPTVSPAPTVDPIVAAAAAVEPYLQGFFELLNSTDDEVREFLWAQANSSVVADFTGDILDAVSNSTIRTTLNSVDRETLSAIVKWGSQILDRALNEVNDVGGNQRRHLEDDSLEDLIPERWMFATAGVFAAFAAVSVCFGLAIVWLPSFVSNVLQFRSGYVGSLHSRDFRKYRAAPDLTAIIFGSSFWGAAMASLYVFFIVFIIVMLVVWPFTRPLTFIVLSNVLAIAVTLGAKTLVLMCLRTRLFKGLFRAQPASSNILLVVLECWSLGLTLGTILARLVKLILVAAFYVGRLDTAVFAEGVGNVFNVPIDSYPIVFRKDLLVHDAHRHPFIERLGMIYMLKLKHGNDFGRAPQSAWRLIVVQALMPWLRRYRVDEVELDEDGNPILPEEDLNRTDTGEVLLAGHVVANILTGGGSVAI